MEFKLPPDYSTVNHDPQVETVITTDLLQDISKLRGKTRVAALRRMAQEEWNNCAESIFFWLDRKRHYNNIPYCMTNERHPQHHCRLCNDGLGHHFNKRIQHLKDRHNIDASTDGELRGFFDQLPGIRPFTILPYMPPIIETWLAEPLIVLEKSRDMIATWLTVAMYTWDTIFHPNRQNIFQSVSAPRTAELVMRAYFIYKQQPKFLRSIHPAVYTTGLNRSGEFHLPTIDSEILGFPQGPDQIRQYHPSGIFTDETAYQAEAGAAFAAIKPAIQAGGRYTGVSSANPSFFQHLAQDTSQDYAD